MLRLPKIPYAMRKNRREILSMRGINYADAAQDGDLADSLNISARRFPYISTRHAREEIDGYSSVTAMTAWDKLVCVDGTSLIFDGKVVGTVLPGDKQFAVVNTKLVIWPDKVYLDLTTSTVKPLGASASGSGATFGKNTLTISGWGVDLTTKFSVGDAVEIEGCSNAMNNKSIIIKALTSTEITTTDDAFNEVSDSTQTVTISRDIPDMDFICESENRLWGCSSTKQTLFASAQGDPTNFYIYEGTSMDSYALPVGSEGAFTGCCKLSSSVLFWKETKLHKILGSYPAEYSLYTYNLEGLRSGCHKSMQVINEVLFYMGLHGVYAYSGGTPSLMSANFGNRDFSDAIAGNDGDSYYLSVKEGPDKHLYVYETRSGIWVKEDEVYCKDFARIGKELYMLMDDGHVYRSDSGHYDDDLEWMAQFTPFYETAGGRKTHSKIILRTELPKGSYMVVEVRFDGGSWKEACKIIGKSNDAVPLRVVMERCDKFEVRLSGKGPCTIMDFVREFSVGSEV